jgi:hypothetical protein
MSDNSKRIFITSDARAKFAGPEHIGPLVERFAAGDIRSVLVATIWADDVPGGDFHIEPGDRPKLVRHLRRILTDLEGDAQGWGEPPRHGTQEGQHRSAALTRPRNRRGKDE